MSVLFEHMQRFVREVFSERLRQEGFVSYKDEDVHWYRLVNDEVIQAVYFVTRHTTLHTTVDIYYACHPLYIPPILQKSPYMYSLPGYEQMDDSIPETVPGSTPYGFESLRIYGMYNRPYRIPDVLITCPQDKNNGLDVLEKLFPVLDSITTPYDCYLMHKKRRAREIESANFWNMSSYFVDEVLYWEDETLYPFCRTYVEDTAVCFENLRAEKKLTRREDQELLLRLQRLKAVFHDGSLLAYKEELINREHKNLYLLQKYAGIIPKR